jgi:hypothetical protein
MLSIAFNEMISLYVLTENMFKSLREPKKFFHKKLSLYSKTYLKHVDK